MNPLTNVKNITKLNEIELKKGLVDKKSWHDDYKESAWIFIGGLAYGLTEGDILAVFSQYGEIVNINLVRDKKTGKTKGYCFLCYANQKSTILAVDNLNDIKLVGRTIRVDHVKNYKPPKDNENDDEVTKELKAEGCAPRPIKIEQTSTQTTSVPVDKLPKLKKVKKEKKKHKKNKKHKKKSSKNSDESVIRRRKASKSESSSDDASSSDSDDHQEDTSSNRNVAHDRIAEKIDKHYNLNKSIRKENEKSRSYEASGHETNFRNQEFQHRESKSQRTEYGDKKGKYLDSSHRKHRPSSAESSKSNSPTSDGKGKDRRRIYQEKHASSSKSYEKDKYDAHRIESKQRQHDSSNEEEELHSWKASHVEKHYSPKHYSKREDDYHHNVKYDNSNKKHKSTHDVRSERHSDYSHRRSRSREREKYDFKHSEKYRNHERDR